MSNCDKAKDALRKHGLLLLQDKRWPSVVGILTDEAPATSWWSHPKVHEIFHCLKQIDETQAISIRLIAGKITFVTRKLWPALVAVAVAGDPWQLTRLSKDGRELLRKVTKNVIAAKGEAVRELQTRLLVVTQEFHSPAGRHELRLETWRSWAERMNVRPLNSSEEGRRELESAVISLGLKAEVLPWHRSHGLRRA